jgi:ribulose-phosphate 3-epimerase
MPTRNVNGIDGKNGKVKKALYEYSISKIFGHKQPERVLALAPSILSSDFANLSDELKKTMRQKIYWAHLDVMDGHFVPNITIGPPVVASIRQISPRLFLDTHLMITDPLDYIDRFAEAGSDIITVHSESEGGLKQAIRQIQKNDKMVGVTIKPKTAVKDIEAVLPDIDMVLIMTVEPGFGGQALMPGALSKVRQLARLRDEKGLRFMIQVDGGINVKTAGLAVSAGANILVAGSAVYGKGRLDSNLKKLREAALEG